MPNKRNNNLDVSGKKTKGTITKKINSVNEIWNVVAQEVGMGWPMIERNKRR